MITDNPVHPKTYEVTKIMDTFPLGVTHVILAQCHHNSNTDICQVLDMGDGNGAIMRMICDYYRDDTSISIGDEVPKWELSNVNRKLYVGGASQTIKAINKSVSTNALYWHISINSKDEEFSELIHDLDSDYIDVSLNGNDTFIENYYKYKDGITDSYYLQDYLDIYVESDTFIISAKSDVLAGYVIKIGISNASDKNLYYDSVEMEVCV